MIVLVPVAALHLVHFLEDFLGRSFLVRAVGPEQPRVCQARNDRVLRRCEDFFLGVDQLLEPRVGGKRGQLRQVARGDPEILVNDLAGEADLDVGRRNGILEFLLEQGLQLPAAQLDRRVVDACVRVATAQRFRVIDTHHVRPVLAIPDLEHTDTLALDVDGLVADPDRRLDVFVGE